MINFEIDNIMSAINSKMTSHRRFRVYIHTVNCFIYTVQFFLLNVCYLWYISMLEQKSLSELYEDLKQKYVKISAKRIASISGKCKYLEMFHIHHRSSWELINISATCVVI